MKVGLNIGAGTGESNCLFPDFDIVYCFEPNDFSFNKLKELNHDNLTLYNYGISDTEGYKAFNNFEHFGYSSLLDLDKSGEFYKRLSQIDAGFDIGTWKTNIKVKRLDTFITENNLTNINLIKIDTQGHDLNVVKSLGSYINIVDTIILECHTKNLYKNSSTKKDIVLYMNNNHFILTHTEKNTNEDLEENLTFKNNLAVQ
jgi:FkbM family methyltransferase